MTDPRPKEQTQWLGEVPVAKNGTMTLPKEARIHLKLELDAADSVLVFSEQGRITVTAVPSKLPAALLQIATEATTPDPSSPEPSTGSAKTDDS